jgi:hypothetical protein
MSTDLSRQIVKAASARANRVGEALVARHAT